jgi:ribonuclease E
LPNNTEATSQVGGPEDTLQAQAEMRAKARNERIAREDNGDAGEATNRSEAPRRDRAPRGENRRNERPRHDESAQTDTPTGLSSTEAPQANDDAGTDNNGERRERRSRDRYGRDRRERGGERTDRQEGAAQEQLGFDNQPADASNQRGQGAGTSGHAQTPLANTATTSATAARASMPKVQHFSLSLPELQAIAQSSGLEWVNSDAVRIAAVQAAIAAEPKPLHVPRERPAPMVLEEGPLVLVETRKELV